MMKPQSPPCVTRWAVQFLDEKREVTERDGEMVVPYWS